MSDINSEILFSDHGLDTDSNNAYMAHSDALYRLHIFKDEDGYHGMITSMKGNRVCSYSGLTLSETYKVGGSYYDQLTRKVYYWVLSQPYDSDTSGDYLYDNRLLCFDEDAETISLVFIDQKNYFGIDMNKPVKDCDMIGDILYFNTRSTEPKQIDVVRAKNYTDYADYNPLSTYVYGQKCKHFGGVFVAVQSVDAGQTPCTNTAKWDRIGDSYQSITDINFDSEFRYAFNVIRHIPVHRPICTFGTDTGKFSNNVRGKVFRFTHRYVYFDNTRSKWSAFSDWALPTYDESYSGEVLDDIDLNNYINVNIPLHSASLVKEIEIAFQEVGMDWKKAKIINRQEQALLDDATYAYKFYNTDSAYEVIDSKEFTEPYDSVPRWAATQELISKNTLVYGGCTLGFDNIPKDEISVTLTPVLEAITIPEGVSAVKRDNIASGDITISTYGHPHLNLTATFAAVAEGDIFVMNLNGKRVMHTLIAGDVMNVGALATAVDNFLTPLFPTLTFTAMATYVEIVSTTEPINIGQCLWYTPTDGVLEAALTKKGGFKTGAWHPLCIFYYDGAMRRCDAQTSKENTVGSGLTINGTSVYVPMFNELASLPSDTANRFKMNWTVSHLPPDYAKWWRWGYAGNSLCTYHVQYVILSIADDPTAQWTMLDIEPLQTIKTTDKNVPSQWNQFPQSAIDPYEWVKGDRVRIITEDADAGALGAIIDGVLDYEILKYAEPEAGGYYIYIQNMVTTGLGAGTLIEIYRPKRQEGVTVFREFGELMPIIEDSTGTLVHGCGATGSVDQETSTDTAASGTFDSGDVYHILRTPSYPISTVVGYFHESQWYSDFYQSNVWDSGREGVETNFGERTLNILQYSNQYLQDTKINGLSTFEALHYKELNNIYGDIVAMEEIGDTLKVYMEKRAASILIGRQEYTDSSGKTVTVTSERVLGSVRYPETNNYGTQWIESVIANNRYTYGFDAYKGVYWRDAANGQMPISVGGDTKPAKMAKWFKDKADALMLSGLSNVSVMSVYDERHDNLYVIFKDKANSDNNETIVYHEPSGRWICFAEFEQTPAEGYKEMLELTYSTLWGFDNGIGYSFDEDSRFSVFSIGGGGGTSAAVRVFPSTLSLTGTLYAPTPTADFLGDMITQEAVTATLYTPAIYITWIDSVPGSLDFAGGEWGQSGKKGLVITVGKQYNGVDAGDWCWITSKPSWLTVTRADGTELGVTPDDFFGNGTIYAYPTTWSALPLSGDLVLYSTFGDVATNSETIPITQAAWTPEPIFYIYVVEGEEFSLYQDEARTILLEQPVVAPYVTGAVGSDHIDFYFYADNVAGGFESVDVSVLNNRLGSIQNTGSVIVDNTEITTYTAYLSGGYTIQADDVFIITIGNEAI